MEQGNVLKIVTKQVKNMNIKKYAMNLVLINFAIIIIAKLIIFVK